MIIGVTTRFSHFSYGTTVEMRDALAHDLINLLSSLDTIPVLIPNVLSDPKEYVERLKIDRLLLSGGGSLGETDGEYLGYGLTERDSTEIALLDWAMECSVPVLGICRGMQCINKYFGGGLTRQLAAAVPSENHVDNNHLVRFKSGSLSGEETLVNSYHDDGILTSQISSNLEILACTEGGVVEALRYPNKSILAIQWHPERLSPSAEIDMELLDSWLNGS